MPARKAMISAEGSRAIRRSAVITGKEGMGKPAGKAPKRAPSVSTGSPKSATAAEAPATARISPGKRGKARRSPTIASTVPAPTARLAPSSVSRAAQIAGSRSMASAGVPAGKTIPTASGNWLNPMMAAMPMVKPLITGSGTSTIRLPARSRPATTRITPAIKVASTSPSKPWVAITACTTTIKAPVGPPICTRLPPSAEIRKPATTAVTNPVAGAAPDAMAMARLSGRATMATVMPAIRSDRTLRGVLWGRVVRSLGVNIGDTRSGAPPGTTPDIRWPPTGLRGLGGQCKGS